MTKLLLFIFCEGAHKPSAVTNGLGQWHVYRVFVFQDKHIRIWCNLQGYQESETKINTPPPQIIKEKSKKTKTEVRIMSSNLEVNYFTYHFRQSIEIGVCTIVHSTPRELLWKENKPTEKAPNSCSIHTFRGVFIQARWQKWESTETATTSQFTSWNSFALLLKATISVGQTKVLGGKREQAVMILQSFQRIF